jgi:hypothetical protein
VTQWARDSPGGVFSIPWANPRADAVLQMLHDLCGDASVNILSFGSVLHCLVLLQNRFFLRETRDGLRAFSGADLSRARFLTRSSKTLDREHRWNNAGFERRGLSREKMKERRIRLRTPFIRGATWLLVSRKLTEVLVNTGES